MSQDFTPPQALPPTLPPARLPVVVYHNGLLGDRIDVLTQEEFEARMRPLWQRIRDRLRRRK